MLSSSLFGKTYNIWLQSRVFALLQAIFAAFSRSFAESKIVHLFVRESRVEQLYADSVFARIFKAIMDGIAWVFGHIFAALRRAAKGSYSAAFAKRFIKTSFFLNYETLLAGFICLMFIVPHDFWANPLAFVATLGLFVLFLLKASAGSRRLYYLHDMGLPVLLFAIACVFSIAFSFARADSFRVFLFYVTALLLLYLIAADITTKERMMKLLGFIYIAVIFSALFAVYQRITGVQVSASLTDLAINKGVPGRVYGTMGNPNNYAEFLVLMTPLAAVFAANVKRLWLRIPLCLGIGLPAIALLMTYSRSGWVSMLLACIVFVYFANKKLIPAFFLVCVAAIPFLPDSVMTRIFSLFNNDDTSNMFRIYVWSGGIQMVRDFFMTGIGLGPESFAAVYPDYAHHLAKIGAPHSHMVYMELIIELGVLGFFSFMWLMLRLWKDSACAIVRSHSPQIKLVLIAALSSLIGIAFTFSVEYVWYYPRVFFAYFILAGIATAAIRITKASEKNIYPQLKREAK
ncbi:MAG: O-antigen ligase family protein [Oscillospiraceae bacterium]